MVTLCAQIGRLLNFEQADLYTDQADWQIAFDMFYFTIAAHMFI